MSAEIRELTNEAVNKDAANAQILTSRNQKLISETF